MGELANCPGCGKLFVKETKNQCKACYEKDEADFETVYRFFKSKENVRATLSEASEQTGVSEKKIIRFIKEGRLRLIELPNLTYPCESCGRKIREGKYCETCMGKFRTTIKRLENDEEESHERSHRYYRVNHL